MIANKDKVRIFLKKMDGICKQFGVNIEGQIAFYDIDTENWSDWLKLTCNGERSAVRYAGPDAEVFDPEEKLEEMHRDLLGLRVDLLDFVKEQLKKRRMS